MISLNLVAFLQRLRTRLRPQHDYEPTPEAAQLNWARAELMPDRIRDMVPLNVVCFGDRDDYIHGHVLKAQQDSPTGPGFHLDKWPARPELGMLERRALITYVPAHAGWLEDWTRVLWVKKAVAPLSEFGIIGGTAVVLDACCTASDDWLYDDGQLRAECRSLVGKPLLGGSGDAKPQQSHGKWILGELVDVLSSMEDADMSEDDLLALLTEVLDRAATKARKAAHNSTLRKAYRVRLVTDELHQ